MSSIKILNQINERIEQSRKQGQVTVLELDSINIRTFTKQMKNVIESHKKIEYLTVNDCQLVSLNNFPYLPNLSILQLSHNQITDDQLFHLLRNSHISHLMIDQNQLKSIQKVSILRQLPNLQQLEISGNRMGDSQFYRQQLFDRIPQIKIIDCHDKYGNIAIQSQSDQQLEQCSIKKINSNRSAQIEDEFNRKIGLGENKQTKQKQLLDLLQQEEEDEQQEEQKQKQKYQSQSSSEQAQQSSHHISEQQSSYKYNQKYDNGKSRKMRFTNQRIQNIYTPKNTYNSLSRGNYYQNPDNLKQKLSEQNVKTQLIDIQEYQNIKNKI